MWASGRYWWRRGELLNYLLDLFLNSMGTVVVLTFAGYLLRETLAKYFSKSVEHRFEKKLEDAKAEIRAKERIIDAQFSAKEKELNHITEFLSSLRRERNSLLQAKRIQAAELVLRACNVYAQLSMAAEMMKILNVDEISKNPEDAKIKQVFQVIVSSLKIDEKLAAVSELDHVLPMLYLNARAHSCFDAHKTVTMHAVALMQCMSMGVDTKNMFVKDALRKQVEKIAPATKEGFDKYGESYAYYSLPYLYDETVKALRDVVNGVEQDSDDLATVKSLTIGSLVTQTEVRRSVAALPEKLKIKDADLPQEGLL